MSQEDRAQDQEIALWELVNAPRPERPVYQPGETGYGPEYCTQCEDDMPALRRRDGRMLCTSCQTAVERKLGRVGR